MLPRKNYLVILMLISCHIMWGQEAKKEKKWSVDGYVKNLVTIDLIRGFDSTWVENQIHHRLNFKWYPNPKLSGYLEIRNRIF